MSRRHQRQRSDSPRGWNPAAGRVRGDREVVAKLLTVVLTIGVGLATAPRRR
jgi:hypothetical protein